MEATDIQEIAWMEEVRDGNVRRAGLLFERYKDPLYNYFLRTTGNRDESQDLVQEVFLRLLKYRATYRGSGTFRGWLFNLARNVSTDRHRARKRFSNHAGDRAEWELNARESESVNLEDGEKWQRVQAALLDLTPEYREVILLSKINELRYKEVARILGCSEGAVKVRVFRALRALRELVGEEPGNGEPIHR